MQQTNGSIHGTDVIVFIRKLFVGNINRKRFAGRGVHRLFRAPFSAFSLFLWNRPWIRPRGKGGRRSSSAARGLRGRYTVPSTWLGPLPWMLLGSISRLPRWGTFVQIIARGRDNLRCRAQRPIARAATKGNDAEIQGREGRLFVQ